MKAGDLIGAYELEAPIARGGMGEIWRARHPTLDRLVAIKFVRAEGLTQLREAFLREVKSLSRLHAPQTVQVLDFGFTEDDAPYMVTEYLEGEDLRARLRGDRAMPLDEALSVGIEVLKSLSEAHAHGIVHRDLKPGNVFLQRVASVDGARYAVKVLDFGVAKLLPSGDADPESTLWPGVTMKGSPRYMAPEQISGDRVTPATDLYAFGGLLYRMIAGLAPFGGGRDEVLQAHLHESPEPLRARCPDLDVPPDLDALLMVCLAKRPEQRPASAEDVRRELERMRVELETSSSGPVQSLPTPELPAAAADPPDPEFAWAQDEPPLELARTEAAMPALRVTQGRDLDELIPQSPHPRPARFIEVDLPEDPEPPPALQRPPAAPPPPPRPARGVTSARAAPARSGIRLLVLAVAGVLLLGLWIGRHHLLARPGGDDAPPASEAPASTAPVAVVPARDAAPPDAAADAGPGGLARSESVLVTVRPPVERFVRADTGKVLCTDTHECRVPIDVDVRLEKAGYTPLVLKGDDLYDRRGNRWSVVIHQAPGKR